MASAEEKKTSQLPVRTGIARSDKLVVLAANTANAANLSTVTVTIDNLFGNTANLRANFSELKINSSLGTPVNSTSTTVEAGTWWTDGEYIYVATANNVVKRGSALSLF